MVVLLGSGLQLASDCPQLVLVLTRFALVVDDLRVFVPKLDFLQVELLLQQIDFVLLLGSKVVVRLLNEIKLLLDDLDLAFELIILLSERICLLSHRLQL